MSKYVLGIVDVHPEYEAARPGSLLRPPLVREIEQAKADRCPIVVLEFPDRRILDAVRRHAEDAGVPVPIGRAQVEKPLTVSWVMDQLKGYDLVAVRNKFDFSGAAEMVYACHDRGWPSDAFRLVGIYAFSCVLKTSDGLRELRPYSRIEVVQDACATDGKDYWFRYDEEVILIPGNN